MGNCIRHDSAMHWGGDDWGSVASEEEEETAEIEGLLCESVSSQSPEAVKVVKVRITKRQLEELLGKVDGKELTVHKAVVALLSSGPGSQHRPWRPALQSIPEVN